MGILERIKKRTEERAERSFEKKLGKEKITAYSEGKRARKESEKAQRYLEAQRERHSRAQELRNVREATAESKRIRREAREIRHPTLARVRKARTEAKRIAKKEYGEAKQFAGARIKEAIQTEKAGMGYTRQRAISTARMRRIRMPRPSSRTSPMIKETRYGGRREITGLGYGIATEYAQDEKQLQDINFFERQDRDFFGEKKNLNYFGAETKKELDFGLGKKKKERYY